MPSIQIGNGPSVGYVAFPVSRQDGARIEVMSAFLFGRFPSEALHESEDLFGHLFPVGSLLDASGTLAHAKLSP
jgi:hypothetical protein